jgi:hypothetical protein
VCEYSVNIRSSHAPASRLMPAAPTYRRTLQRQPGEYEGRMAFQLAGQAAYRLHTYHGIGPPITMPVLSLGLLADAAGRGGGSCLVHPGDHNPASSRLDAIRYSRQEAKNSSTSTSMQFNLNCYAILHSLALFSTLTHRLFRRSIPTVESVRTASRPCLPE